MFGIFKCELTHGIFKIDWTGVKYNWIDLKSVRCTHAKKCELALKNAERELTSYGSREWAIFKKMTIFFSCWVWHVRAFTMKVQVCAHTYTCECWNNIHNIYLIIHMWMLKQYSQYLSDYRSSLSLNVKYSYSLNIHQVFYWL